MYTFYSKRVWSIILHSVIYQRVVYKLYHLATSEHTATMFVPCLAWLCYTLLWSAESTHIMLRPHHVLSHPFVLLINWSLIWCHIYFSSHQKHLKVVASSSARQHCDGQCSTTWYNVVQSIKWHNAHVFSQTMAWTWVLETCMAQSHNVTLWLGP